MDLQQGYLLIHLNIYSLMKISKESYAIKEFPFFFFIFKSLVTKYSLMLFILNAQSPSNSNLTKQYAGNFLWCWED